MAAVGTILFTACSNEEIVTPAGGDGSVTFTFVPEGALSRAYSDGLTATTLHYAAYEAGTGTVVYTSNVADDPKAVKAGDRNFTLTLNLVKGKSYDFVFWADKGEGSPYTFDENTQSVSVAYDAPVAGNDEGRDAFFQTVKDFKVIGPAQESVVLRRPFAQINIGTSDLAEAAKLNTVVASTSLNVKGVHNALNLYTGIASGEADVEFTATGIPEGETFPNVKEGVTYDYLSMNYVLTGVELEGDDVQKAKSELLDCVFTMNYEGGKIQDITLTNVPVQRNYRTNIFGALITSPLDFSIIVDQDYYDPDNNYSQLLLAAAIGGEVELTADVDFGGAPLKVETGKLVTINLNGHNLDNAVIENWGSVVIDGDGTISAPKAEAGKVNPPVIWSRPGSDITINGGTFVGSAIEGETNPANNPACIYAQGVRKMEYGSTLTKETTIKIYGGTFESPENAIVLNEQNNEYSHIVIYGGKFKGQDPRKGDDVKGGNFVAPGYSAVESEEGGAKWYTVVEGVNTPEGMVAAIADPTLTDVKILEDLNLSATTAEELTFDTEKVFEISDGKTLTLPASQPLVANNGLTVRGGTITNAAASSPQPVRGRSGETAAEADHRCLIKVYGGDLVLDGVTLVNDMNWHQHGEKFNNAAIAYWGDTNVTITNSTIKSGGYTICGMRTPAATGNIVLKNTYFESNSSNKHGDWAYALRINGKTALVENCTVKGVQGGISAERGVVMTIKSGKYYTEHSDASSQDAFYPVYVTSSAKVVIEGGEFSSPIDRSGGFAEGTSCLVAGDNDVQSPTGSIEIRGGKFSGKAYDHARKIQIPAADGYEYQAIEGDATYKWTVVKK